MVEEDKEEVEVAEGEVRKAEADRKEGTIHLETSGTQFLRR